MQPAAAAAAVCAVVCGADGCPKSVGGDGKVQLGSVAQALVVVVVVVVVVVSLSLAAVAKEGTGIS